MGFLNWFLNLKKDTLLTDLMAKMESLAPYIQSKIVTETGCDYHHPLSCEWCYTWKAQVLTQLSYTPIPLRLCLRCAEEEGGDVWCEDIDAWKKEHTSISSSFPITPNLYQVTSAEDMQIARALLLPHITKRLGQQ